MLPDVSRILYRHKTAAIICLSDQYPGLLLPRATTSSPIWPCCGRSLHCRQDSHPAPVVSYSTFSPLPVAGRYSFCCTCLPAAYRPQYPPFQEDSLLYAVRTFLSKFPPGVLPRLPTDSILQRCNIHLAKLLYKSFFQLFGILLPGMIFFSQKKLPPLVCCSAEWYIVPQSNIHCKELSSW